LKAENLTKTFKTEIEDINVISSLSLEVNEGEILAIYGPSGAGKSTLLHLLGTLDNFDSGELHINNIKINSSSGNAKIRRENLGFVFQLHHLLPEFTVLENLLIPQMLINTDVNYSKEFARELLNSMNLLNRQNHYPDQISGGERQRVAVLRALVNKPAVVIADEPTGNLDSENSKLLLDLIVKLNQKYKQTFIIATHDLKIEKIADRSMVLQNGELKLK